ncbi:biotin-dependent carboxyltransferase [Marinobacter halodurans]|uniref:Biotin-dependent carboxyltransferase n=1 Tax=Marinobacter halodurans TaxID=2528979 RepID=A0ABY1ZMJ5_9GAMM|nr:biotin-dependent carboxyltransferase family protein [Marinobacter halodurans]TBW56058.1 biotin-dependent carboxyltransferase [Marinobacter halodurans]
MSGLEVHDTGLRATLQDEGRRHGQHLGLAVGGAADLHAFRWANKLLDNPRTSACLEVLMGGFSAEATGTMSIAVTGAASRLFINDRRQSLWRTHTLHAGDTISLEPPSNGLLNYIAVPGGWQGNELCQSRSMTPREGLPGLTVIEPDQLIEATSSDVAPERHVPQPFLPDYAAPLTLNVIPGYQHTAFSHDARRTLTTRPYTVTQQIDRMGYRLSGAAIKAPDMTLLSEGIALGALQIPTDGQPIVLLNDRQTMGGYPKIGTVAALDCSRLCQRKPDTEVRFRFAELANVQCERVVFEAFFGRTEWADSRTLRWR